MNKIEPLETLLKIYKNKHWCLMNYLPNETIIHLTNTNYVDENEETLYLDEMIYLIKKNTGLLEKKGKTIKITEDKITIRIQNKYNLCFLKDDYYIFKKIRKRKSKKDMYESLFNSLQ